MVSFLSYIIPTSQGWVLTILSSLLCVSGAFIIYFDQVYQFVFPKFITSRYQFHLKGNYAFLNGSLAFSSGCLIFTSLYRLLPEASKYLQKSDEEDDGDNSEKEVGGNSRRKLQFYLMSSYFGGILICSFFNIALHLITSESIVHCNHGGDIKSDNDHHRHHHHHNHSQQHQGHNHGHRHQQQHHSDDDDEDEQVQQSKSIDTSKVPAAALEYLQDRPANKQSILSVVMHDHENAPLIRKTLKPRKSFLQMFLKHADDDEVTVGECKGYSSAERCGHNEGHENELHYCELPELTNDCASNEQIESRDVGEEGEENEERQEEEENNHHDEHSHGHSHSHQSHHSHEPDHHHHTNSPLSRLLLIGIQTTLAITLHKLPEGFVTYITSETNPTLGISIFISLILHNFTEGFSMCLPLYFSMAKSSKYAKIKAVTISAVLGGLAQPLGALLGYFFLQFNQHYNLSRLDFIFGVTIALTSGFLTVVALSMYGSAVAFGGNANQIMLWCIIGIILIGSSSILSAK
ncbi:uncharacterized protein LODBEIA_P44330 [Lodderomyces beijingensis]|uniref:Uncharacterized protein n=1 Tax=Lodderomyces beijingensis TaxID=1775926 RepID=A0ABP0ZPY7_9ASCO